MCYVGHEFTLTDCLFRRGILAYLGLCIVAVQRAAYLRRQCRPHREVNSPGMQPLHA